MKTIARTNPARRRAGGLAALYLAAAYLLAMPFFLVVVKYPGVTDPMEKVALLARHHTSLHVMYLITYVVFGIVLAALALALYQRLESSAPLAMRVATVVGLLWAFVLVASGMVFNAGMAAAVALYPSDPGGAVSLWQAVEPVAQGLGGSGGELLGGLWVLLVSYASLRAGEFPRQLCWLGLAVGLAGIVSVVPPLNGAAYAFGLLQIAWFVWLG
ncbi:MAG TPA: DUF4386 family protein, partial [Methanoregulaceae archaeon]|nr:DUF4386 family protein [Methanoregulaceae archaeon]